MPPARARCTSMPMLMQKEEQCAAKGCEAKEKGFGAALLRT